LKFDAQRRIRLSGDFRAARERGEDRSCGPFLARYRFRDPEDPTATLGPRLGIIASRRVGNAVCRNRAKRRVRALFVKHFLTLTFALDLVIIVRKTFPSHSFADLDIRFGKLATFLTTSHE